jgi:hypothetical protein
MVTLFFFGSFLLNTLRFDQADQVY